jgi:hypothetical protein
MPELHGWPTDDNGRPLVPQGFGNWRDELLYEGRDELLTDEGRRWLAFHLALQEDEAACEPKGA